MNTSIRNSDDTVQYYRRALQGAREILSDLGVSEERFDELFEGIAHSDPKQLPSTEFYRILLQGLRVDTSLYYGVVRALRAIEDKRELAPDVYTANYYPKVALYKAFSSAILTHIRDNPKRPEAAQTALVPDFWNQCTLDFATAIILRYRGQVIALSDILAAAKFHPKRIGKIVVPLANLELGSLARMGAFNWAVWDALAADREVLDYMIHVWIPTNKGPFSFGTHVVHPDGTYRRDETPPTTELVVSLSHLYRTQLKLHDLI